MSSAKAGSSSTTRIRSPLPAIGPAGRLFMPTLRGGVARSRVGGRHGKAHRDRRAARRGVEADPPAVGLHDPAAEVEAEPAARHLPVHRPGAPEEALEDVVAILGGDPPPIVGDRHDDGRGVEPARPDLDDGHVARVLLCVLDEVRHHLPDARRIHVDAGQPTGDLEAHGSPPRRLRALGNEGAQEAVERDRRAAQGESVGLELAHVDDVVDEGLEPLRGAPRSDRGGAARSPCRGRGGGGSGCSRR